MKRNRLATLAMGVALAAAMTGCGDDGGSEGSGGSGGSEGSGDSDFAESSATDIVEAAQDDMGELTFLHLAGDINSDGSSIEMDLSLSTEGTCEGTITLDGGGLEVLQAEDGAWFKADQAFWEAQAPDQAEQIVAMTEGKWIVDSSQQYTSFCDLEGFLSEISSDSDEDFEVDGTEDVDGQEAVKITGDDSTAFIAVDEPHYILQLEGSGAEEGSITFSEFDEEFEVTAPSADEIVDLDSVG